MELTVKFLFSKDFIILVQIRQDWKPIEFVKTIKIRLTQNKFFYENRNSILLI